MSVAAVNTSKIEPTVYDSQQPTNSKLTSLIEMIKRVAAVLLIGPVVVGLVSVVVLTPFIALEGGLSLLMATSFSWNHVFGFALTGLALKLIVKM